MTGPPQRIGGYEVGCEIGRGGMGIVYKAHDPRLGRAVAIKALPEEYVRDESRLDRFLQEARVLAQLQSPHIAAIHHLETGGGLTHLILEFVEGASLAERLLHGPASVRQALSWARQIALALEAAHSRGIIHRDLKPGNIMITPQDEVKVLDFGLAKLVPARSAHPEATTIAGRPSEIGEALGTPGYMSPEQMRGEPVDERADIWAFGCVLYECLTAQRAFPGRSQHDAVSAVLRDEPDFSLLSQAVPQRIRDLLRRCLSKDQDRRLRDIGDARIEIEDALSPPAGDAASGGMPPIPTNLPGDLTSFIGRRTELDEVAALLNEHRLVTLHGSGGSGKTRVGLQVAREVMPRFPDGVWMIELAGLSDGSLLAHTAAGAVGVRDLAGDPAKALVEHLQDQRALIVLDNCEHLVAQCAALVDGVLRACADVSTIATSREPLRIAGEQCFEVRAMGLPGETARSADEVSRHESAQLFLERGRLVRQGFSINEGNALAVSQICRRLDGIPLAIELAAARLRALPPAEIMARLAQCFDLLSRGPRGRGSGSGGGDRHRTLSATVQWSYDLLEESERRLFRRLSVFRGGWTLEAAEAIGDGAGEPVIDLLEALVEKSLVVLEERDASQLRYRMLEIIRQYGESRFGESGERDQARAAHLKWCLALAEQAEIDLSAGREQQRWLPVLAAEHDNFRTALQHALGTPGESESAVRLANGIHRFWYLRGHLTEGRRWYAQAEAHLKELPDVVRGKAHLAAGILAWAQGDYAAAQREYNLALPIWKQQGDHQRVAAVLTNLGIAALEGDADFPKAREQLEEAMAIYEGGGNAPRAAMVKLNLAAVSLAQQRYEETARLLEECRNAFEECHDHHRLGYTFYNLARLCAQQGRFGDGEDACRRAVGIARDLRDASLLAQALMIMASLKQMQSRHAAAAQLCAVAVRLHEELAIERKAHDVAEIVNRIKSEGRAGLGSATFDELWSCARSLDPFGSGAAAGLIALLDA